jgi:hypothetical protein
MMITLTRPHPAENKSQPGVKMLEVWCGDRLLFSHIEDRIGVELVAMFLRAYYESSFVSRRSYDAPGIWRLVAKTENLWRKK